MPSGREHFVALLLEGQIGDDGDQIGVAAALAEAVDRALHLHGPGVDGGQRIGHGQLAVVVAMDADRHIDGRRARRGSVRRFRSGMLPPLVSHSTIASAPAAAAAWIVLRAYSGLLFQPSKKCSAS